MKPETSKLLLEASQYSKTINDEKVLQPQDDERLRLFANLIIDRMLEDQKNGLLKFKK